MYFSLHLVIFALTACIKMERQLCFLLIFSVISYTGTFGDVISAHARIDHAARKSYCCGAKTLRKRSNKYNELFPVLDCDYNEQNQFFVTICDHSPCLSSNTEFEFTVGHLVLDNKLTRLNLNSIRPISRHDVNNENISVSPQFGQPAFGCW